MVIKEVTRQHRLDFFAKFQCEHCGSISTGQGYNDGYYMNSVLPFCKCPSCGLQSIKGVECVSYGGFKLITKKDLPEGYEPPASYYAGKPTEEGWKASERYPEWPPLYK